MRPDDHGDDNEPRFKGTAEKIGDSSGNLEASFILTPEDVIARLKRNVDYWEGIEGVEEKTNEELANYLVEDFLSDLKISVTPAQSRFLLEIADRLRGKGPLSY